PLSTILASPLHNRCQFGVKKDRSTLTIPGAGFNGIAAIISAAASARKMRARSNDGKQCAAIFIRFRRIAPRAICAAAGSNDRRFSSGLTTVEQSEAVYDLTLRLR